MLQKIGHIHFCPVLFVCKYEGRQPPSFSGVAIASALCAGYQGTKGKGKQKIIRREIVHISPLYLALL